MKTRLWGTAPAVGLVLSKVVEDDGTTSSGPAGLRADIRRLGNLLGETLARQEGPELLALVEDRKSVV
jgi:hypothetical protein